MTSKYRMKTKPLKTEGDILESIRKKNSERRITAKGKLKTVEIKVEKEKEESEEELEEIPEKVVKGKIKVIKEKKKDKEEKKSKLTEREDIIKKKEDELAQKEREIKKKKKKAKEKELQRKLDRLEQLNLIQTENTKLKDSIGNQTKTIVKKQVKKQLVPVKIGKRYSYVEKQVKDLADKVIGY